MFYSNWPISFQSISSPRINHVSSPFKATAHFSIDMGLKRMASLTRILMELAKPIPVSYTHLDVYKRQLFVRLSFLEFLEIKINLFVMQ